MMLPLPLPLPLALAVVSGAALALPLPLALAVVSRAALALPGILPTLHCPLNATKDQCWSSNSTPFRVKGDGVNFIYDVDNLLMLVCNDNLQLDSVPTLRWLPQFTPALHVTNVSVTSCRPAHYATVFAALNVTLTSPLNLELDGTRLDEPVTGVHFADLPPLRHLTLLDMVRLQLHGPLPSSLEGLTSLTVERTSLWNSYTILESPPRNLTELRLVKVNITHVPAAVLDLPELRSLHVDVDIKSLLFSRQPFYQLVIEQGKAPRLQHLYVDDVDGALMSKWAPPVLEEVTLLNWGARTTNPLPACDKLVKLTFSSLHLRELPDGLVAHCPRLEELSINKGNKWYSLWKVPANMLENASQLTKLSISFTRMSQLPAQLFEGTPNLTHLDLSLNRFTELPAKLFAYTPKLTQLNLKSNELKELSTQLFEGTPNLTHLDLSLNRLTELPESLFVNTPKLTHLGLNSNELKELSPQLFEDTSNLTHLDLGLNQLKELPAKLFANTSNLTHLNLSYNQLTQLPRTLLQLPLLSLDLGNNKFNKSVAVQLAAVTELRTLSLAANTEICNLCAVDDTHVSGTTVHKGKSSLASLSKLERLDLQNSSVTVICRDWREDMVYLRYLDLRNTKIVSLTELDLRNNSISSMTEETAHALVRGVNRRVLLAGNRLASSCDTAPALRVLRDHSSVLVGYDALRCEDGRTLEDAIDACWTLTAIVVTATLPTVTTAALALCLWWKRRAVLGHSRALVWRLGWRPREDRDTAWTVDAFVIFSRGDETAALELTAQLELNARRVLLAERDWLAPALLSECIAQSVRAARRTIALVSREWERSLEMQATAYTPAARRGALVLVLPPAGTPPARAALRRYATDFPHLVLRRDAPDFWRRLERAVPSSAPAPTHIPLVPLNPDR